MSYLAHEADVEAKLADWSESKRGRLSVKNRLLSHMIQDEVSGCWEWQAHRNKKGYGRISVKRDFLMAHRVSYEIFVGPIPTGLRVLHHCDNRGCINPAHLLWRIKRKYLRHSQKTDKEAHPMTEHSFVRCEAVKTAYRQTKEGMVVSFAIHPNAMPPELALAPVGTRVLLAVAELTPDEDRIKKEFTPLIGDETLAAAPSAVPISSARDAARDRYRYTLDAGQKAVVRAGLLCKEERFWRWQERTMQLDPGLITNVETSAVFLRLHLRIGSRSEIASNEEVYRKFLDLEFAYRGHAEQRG